MRAYSEDLRARVVRAVEQGKQPREVAKIFDMSITSVRRFVRQKRKQGHLRSQLPPGRPRTLSVEHEAALTEQVKVHQDASLKEHTKLLEEATGQQVSLMTVQRTLLRLGITRKKDKATE